MRRRAFVGGALALGAAARSAIARDDSAGPSPLAPLSLAGQQTQGGWLRGRLPDSASALRLAGTPIAVAADRTFFLGFDRDAPASLELAIGANDGGSRSFALPIAPRAWRIEQVDAPFRPPAIPDAEFQRIRAGELARIAEARSRVTAAQGWRQEFAWPARGRISGLFGAQRIYRGTPGSYHSGIDIAGGQGTPYTAPADGVVVLAAASPFTLEGNLLILDHGSGLNSAFLHSSELLVGEGDRVVQGQPIGRIGMSGRATGPHLHWALKWRESRLDPMLFAGGG